jgi:hypothetical protein
MGKMGMSDTTDVTTTTLPLQERVVVAILDNLVSNQIIFNNINEVFNSWFGGFRM